MGRLLEAARRAYDQVPLYRTLYGARPRAEAEIPFISHVSYHRARGVLDCIAAEDDILGAVPAYRRKSRALPVTPLQSDEEWNDRLARLLAGLERLDILPADGPLRFLMIADEATGPFAGELSNALGWVKHQASITYHDDGKASLDGALEAFAPDVAVVVTPKLASGTLAPWGGRSVFVTHLDSEDLADRSCDRLLVCDELHVLGARPAGGRAFHCDAADLAIEREPYSGQTAVTTLNFTCFPLIRYALGRALNLAVGDKASHA